MCQVHLIENQRFFLMFSYQNRIVIPKTKNTDRIDLHKQRDTEQCDQRHTITSNRALWTTFTQCSFSFNRVHMYLAESKLEISEGCKKVRNGWSNFSLLINRFALDDQKARYRCAFCPFGKRPSDPLLINPTTRLRSRAVKSLSLEPRQDIPVDLYLYRSGSIAQDRHRRSFSIRMSARTFAVYAHH